jgi:hypothetical protein
LGYDQGKQEREKLRRVERGGGQESPAVSMRKELET